MGSNLHLYHTWRKHCINGTRPESRLTNLVLLVVGLYWLRVCT